VTSHTFDARIRRVQVEREVALTVLRPQAVDLQFTRAPTGTDTCHVTHDVSVAASVRVLDVEAASVRHEAVLRMRNGHYFVRLIAGGTERRSGAVFLETCTEQNTNAYTSIAISLRCNSISV